MSFQVNVPGYAIDGATAELLIEGRPLSASVESMKWSRQTTEEIIHYLGLKDPVERTGGSNEYSLEGSMGMRQYMLMAQEIGNSNGGGGGEFFDAFQDVEFTWVLNLRPKRDGNIYTFEWRRYRITKDDFNVGMKEKSSVNFSGSALKMTMRVGG